MNEDTKKLMEWISMLETKVQTINERTKRQTIQIKELKKVLKEKEK